MASRHDDDKAEHPIFAVAAAFAILLVFGCLIWLVASNRIVYGSLKPALFLGALWKIWPSDYTFSQWNHIVSGVQAFAPRPREVSFVDWAEFMTIALRPITAIVMAVYVLSLLFLATKKRTFMRRFTATNLMELSANRFTGVAPVVAIRKLIAKNKHPLWRRQVTPEEVFKGFKVPDTVRSLAPPGTPMVVDGKFNREVARTYFMGLVAGSEGPLLRSTMLGRQVVDLLTDAGKERAVVFADRMSAEGKTLLALWSAVAFGGVQGRDEFARYRDMLNRSAYGTRDGMANLALAQPLYDKYRKHPMLNKIFAIHHWEHTVLFFLLSLAQAKGRFTTAEVLWLRPTNRVMFFALNSRGSYTPHTEAAATFTQHRYEHLCAKQGRLPLVSGGDGRLMHMIYIDKAIDGLELEYARWAEGSDDEDDWWMTKNVWARTNVTLNQEFAKISAAVPTAGMPGTTDEDTAFDRSTSQEAEARAAAEAQELENELGRVFGAGAKTVDPT
jgi:hypothetical protein